MSDSALTKEEEEKYARGYNAFSFIKQYEPDLVKELDSIKADGAYFDGLRQGRTDDRVNEFYENKLPDWMEGVDPIRDQFDDNEKDITKDPSKEDVDPKKDQFNDNGKDITGGPSQERDSYDGPELDR
ncbi:hypothetical protein [uncultured Algoriphagus sp.]|uniref:hypothetical protein n=1 Tax=uncultured Algoriphagus sp. TaxID=417365 RepID=UPI0030EBAE45|tara:strand:- start:4903 stop:5286 length:384 start_codon:yes stop_codon:yes gene_type:complete